MDSRGVQRGACTQCSCAGYDGGVNKKKCESSGCGHPPGRHLNLTNDQAQPPGSCEWEPGLYERVAIYTALGFTRALCVPFL